MKLDGDQNTLLAEWRASKAALDLAKEQEAQHRARVGMEIFYNARPGANTIELGGGYRCTYTPKINYKLMVPVDENQQMTINTAMENLADEMRRASNEGAFIFERLVKFKPELSVSEYKKLSPELKAVVDPYVITSEGAPTLEIKDPAKKGE